MIRQLIKWSVILIVMTVIMGGVLTLKVRHFEFDALFVGFSVGLGLFVTLAMVASEWGSHATSRSHRAFREADPSWNYVAMSGWTAAGYSFGVLFFLLMGLMSLGLAMFYHPESGSRIGMLVVSSGLVLLFLGFACAGAVPPLTGWLSIRRWNETHLERHNRLSGPRTYAFKDLVSAGVWPVVGVVGLRFADGHCVRFSQDIRGACGLYARARREQGPRFRGSSMTLDNQLAELGLDAEGRPLHGDGR
jgi:hypothetical protein